MIKTLQFKLRNPPQGFIREAAEEVNAVWNATNEAVFNQYAQFRKAQDARQVLRGIGCLTEAEAQHAAQRFSFPSAFDQLKQAPAARQSEQNPRGYRLQRINAAVEQRVIQEHAVRRFQFKKLKLNWRISDPTHRKHSLGWVPLKQENLSIGIDGVRLAGKVTKTSRPALFRAFLKGMELLPLAPSVPWPRLDHMGYLDSFEAFVRQARQRAETVYAANQAAKGAAFLATQKPQVTLKILGRNFRVFNEKFLRYYLTDLGAVVKTGTLSQDSLGDWYVNLAVDLDAEVYFRQHLIQRKGWSEVASIEVVGIDPGCDRIISCSTGQVVEKPTFFKTLAKKISSLQRNGHNKQAKRVHRRARRKRNDLLDKTAHGLAKHHQVIKMGDLPVQRLARRKPAKKPGATPSIALPLTEAYQASVPSTGTPTKHRGPRLGKSLLENGIGMLKQKLASQCHQAGRSFALVPEPYSTQVCSNCDHFTGPKGLKQLGVRSWVCTQCSAIHDRDVNAGTNHARTEVGKTLLQSVPRCGRLFAEMRSQQCRDRFAQA